MVIRLVFILLVGIAWVRLCGGKSKDATGRRYGAEPSAQSAHLKKREPVSGFLLLEEDVGGRRIPSTVATAPGILSESITLVLAAPSARPTGMCRPSDGRAIGLLPMPNHKTPRVHAIKLSALKTDPENCRLHTRPETWR